MKWMTFVLLAILAPNSAFALSIPTFPKSRPNVAPVLSDPFLHCVKPLKDQGEAALFTCAETEFWSAFSDGRLSERKDAEHVLSNIIIINKNSSEKAMLGRVYALRGYLRLAMALENGAVQHLLLGTMEGDFKKAKEWDPTNKTYDTFLDTIVMAKAAVFGNWDKAVSVALPAFEILGDHPVNILALSGTTIGFPLTTGIPQKTIEILDQFTCPEDIAAFCYENTLHAPYARPGLSFHFAEAYARMGNREKAEEFFLKAKNAPGFEDWQYKDLVEKPLSNMDNYINYWTAFKKDESLINKVYANQNFGCLLCHGR